MTTQKPEPRILTFTKPDNIKGSVHGKISAYQEIWNIVEEQRHKIFMDKNMLKYGLAYNNTTRLQFEIRDKLKNLGCTDINSFQKWLDND
tara:strand:- start:39 stop:308 length:270 start_codon:yes stop_codon:yes gene_type:complete